MLGRSEGGGVRSCRHIIVLFTGLWYVFLNTYVYTFLFQICEAVRDGGAVVWANTAVEGGLLGRSDLPLRTAVGAPVCTQGSDLCVLVLFSPSIIKKSSGAMDFLYTLAQAASDTTNAFLPASASSPVQPVTFPTFRWRNAQFRLQRLNAIRDSLPRDVTFDTDSLAMGPVSVSRPCYGVGGEEERALVAGERLQSYCFV